MWRNGFGRPTLTTQLLLQGTRDLMPTGAIASGTSFTPSDFRQSGLEPIAVHPRACGRVAVVASRGSADCTRDRANCSCRYAPKRSQARTSLTTWATSLMSWRSQMRPALGAAAAQSPLASLESLVDNEGATIWPRLCSGSY